MTVLRTGLALALWGCALQAPAADAVAAADDKTRADTIALVSGLFTDKRYNYRPRALDDALSAELFDAWLAQLDPDRLYLSAADIGELQRHRKGLDDAIRARDLAPFLAMRELALTRLDARVAKVPALLAQGFDFDGQDDWTPDRAAAPWAADAAALDALWLRRIKSEALDLSLAGRTPAQVRATLERRYAQIARAAHAPSPQAVFEAVLDTYAGVSDSGGDYYSSAAAQRLLDAVPDHVGVGMSLKRGNDDTVSLVYLSADGPAARAGLRSGDRLLATGEGENDALEDVAGVDLDALVTRLRGRPGSRVRVQVQPFGSLPGEPTRTVVLERARAGMAEQRATQRVLEVGGKRIGVIVPGSFYVDFARMRTDADHRSVSRDVAELLRQLQAQRVDAVLVDLRDNEGGALNQVPEVFGLFMRAPAVVQLREGGGRVELMNAQIEPVWTGPMAVLVNARSAAASEMFAAAVQDYGRGLVIGHRTYGRGSIQNLIDLDRWPNNQERRYGQVRMSVAHAFRVSGLSLDGAGVTPDLSLLADTTAAPKPGPRMVAMPGYKAPAAPVVPL
ncbi:MAG: tail-specific protease, partial [Lysobacter sp.]|nr:tail-specific protease [Lysobacter sp.]